ncbi:hypothetical protein [Secundilactobacillus similis]|uniref:Integral membrane protein n=1 Tax=Secundilactobacillus similis DSM 23365 = JCM 2765 TaxID=1423804 RepID=A0A0R2F4D3_9LACO|nr:hypothetical protein [Secundilactobacillus similis]KRN19300.1 hypothetical protein FD14_GL001710 [Secundilactobacillus similis DSM 23365 = JCM 2765]
MLKKQLISLGIVSWALFSVINLVMSSKLAAFGHTIQAGSIVKSLVISVILYAVPMVIGALGQNWGYYVLGLVIMVYSLGLVNGILAVWGQSHASLGIRAILVLVGCGAVAFNFYWLTVAFKYRKQLQNKRDDELLKKLNQNK